MTQTPSSSTANRATSPERRRLLRARRRGFILAYVLILLALTSVLLVSFARRNLDQELAIAERESSLRSRWSDHSCRVAFSRTAPQLFAAALAKSREEPDRDEEPPATIQAAFALNGRRCDVTLADESAKLNVNTLWKILPGRALAVLQGVVETGDGVSLKLRPQKGVAFAFADLRQLFGVTSRASASGILQAAARITCYGDGRLQFHSAPDAVLETYAKLFFEPDEADALVTLRRTRPAEAMEALAREIAFDQDERQALARYFTETSSHFSVWILIQDPSRPRASLVVSDPSSKTAALVSEW